MRLFARNSFGPPYDPLQTHNGNNKTIFFFLLRSPTSGAGRVSLLYEETFD